MVEIDLSIMDRSLHPIPDIQPTLDQFEAETNVHVNLTVLEWDSAWSEVLKTALYRHGPDISEMGSTWVSSLVGMNSLRPFSNEELAGFGGPGNFIPSLWESGKLAGETRLWAFPWLGYTRVIYYRRDLLEKAGIDEKTAFQTHAQLVKTLIRVQEMGGCTPWGVPTRFNDTTPCTISLPGSGTAEVTLSAEMAEKSFFIRQRRSPGRKTISTSIVS